MNDKKIGMIMVIIGVIIIMVGIVLLIPKKPTYVEQVNLELNSEQLQVLIKEMTKTLSAQLDINSANKYTADEMVAFTYAYTAYLDIEKKYTSIDEENSLGIIDVNTVEEKVNYLFADDNFDISNITYEVKDEKIYIPLNLQDGDAQIFKYVETTYNEQTGEYIATIDCLEPQSAEDASNLLKKTEYNKEDVIYTLQIKYKVVEGRRVLLSYSGYSNLEY